MPTESAAYRFDEFGWLQFERLCEFVLERETGLADLDWRKHADVGRVASVMDDVALAHNGVRLAGPVAVAVVWVRPDPSEQLRLVRLCEGASSAAAEVRGWSDRLLVLTNLDSLTASAAIARWFPELGQLAVLGSQELGGCVDRDSQLRAAMPSVLGVRDLDGLLAEDALTSSTLDVPAAQDLARVFWATRAYQRARSVLSAHRFVVLTGPPEMGKTAIARMLALVQLTDGWEAHECNAPEEVWRAFDRSGRQVFVADDAFGSTEYRPDAADRWARELGRMLRALDDDHWLIWTSRPAPLKAGLRRLQRERCSERFPAPGEVLVDASELDLAEKTLILFRHAKHRNAGNEARRVLRSTGVEIVEHPHFTPERIRRFVADSVERLQRTRGVHGQLQLKRLVEAELTRPTEAMRTSFEALEHEHRQLLIALLDAPAGLINERELAAAMRRHHPGGLRRPPAELIDRLTDHFLRVTPLGIGWVHPSWRDLVIEQLRQNASARAGFLETCGVYGAMLALSHEGGARGERLLPLLIEQRDWDRLGDRLAVLLRELEDQQLGQLLLAVAEALSATTERRQRVEADCLATYLLGATRRAWETKPRQLPVSLLEAWYALNELVAERAPSPPLELTWIELHPTLADSTSAVPAEDLPAIDDWLALAQLLAAHDPEMLNKLGFYARDPELLMRIAIRLSELSGPETRPLVESALRRIEELAPEYGYVARATAATLELTTDTDRWWIPEDIPAPPSSEPLSHERAGFTRTDVARVLSDL